MAGEQLVTSDTLVQSKPATQPIVDISNLEQEVLYVRRQSKDLPNEEKLVLQAARLSAYNSVQENSEVGGQPFRKEKSLGTDWDSVMNRLATVQSSRRVIPLTKKTDLIEFQVPLQKLSPTFNLRMLLISDYHFASNRPFRQEEFIRVMNSLNDFISPVDMVMSLGDSIQSGPSDLTPRALEGLDKVAPYLDPKMKRYVLGNHDYAKGAAGILESIFQDHGFTSLNNRHLRIRLQEGALNLWGIDDYWKGTPIVPEIPDRLKEEAHTLFLHNPDGLDARFQDMFQLATAGHIHGGKGLLGAPVRFIEKKARVVKSLNGQEMDWGALSSNMLFYNHPCQARNLSYNPGGIRRAVVIFNITGTRETEEATQYARDSNTDTAGTLAAL